MQKLASYVLVAFIAAVTLSGCGGEDCLSGSVKCGSTCVVLAEDNLNCGACGNACLNGQFCSGGVCSGSLSFGGVVKNLPISSLTGWSQCFLQLYNVAGGTLNTDIPAACTKANILVGCRATGAATLTLAAMAPRADVFFVTGNVSSPGVTHLANGVAWYFDDNYSMGFAKGGDAVTLSECDVATTPNSDLRLCWHTLNTAVGGYRCGATTGLNSSTAWERIVFHAD